MMYHKSNPDSVKICCDALRNGDVIIIPTDTVYGFSAVVDKTMNTDEKIRKIKGRSETKPFIQLIGNPEDIYKYTDDKIPTEVLSHWPGPLTIIVHDKNSSGTTAYRCPDDKWLCSLLNELKNPVYSTSANRSGEPQIEKVEQLEKEFSDEVKVIIDDGDRVGGVPSTIISIENNQVKVLREGAVKL